MAAPIIGEPGLAPSLGSRRAYAFGCGEGAGPSGRISGRRARTVVIHPVPIRLPENEARRDDTALPRAPTGIAGFLPAIPRRAWPLSGTKPTPRQAVR